MISKTMYIIGTICIVSTDSILSVVEHFKRSN